MNIGQMLARQKELAEHENMRRIIREMEEARRALRLAKEALAKHPQNQEPSD